MIELGLFAIAAFWVVCAVLTQGLAIAHFQGKYPTIAKDKFRGDWTFGLLYGLFGGPVTLLLAFFFTGFAERGFQWRRK